MYRRQQSKPFLAEIPKILTEFLYSVMDRDLAFRQEGLKRELSHFRYPARLRERQPLLLEESQCEFLPELGFADVSRGKHFV
jgi:hypothetical protein